MKTMNYKNVVVVAKTNNALVATSDKFKTFMNCTDSTVASLQAMKAFLESIPTSAEEIIDEPVQIILGSKSAIKGFASGTYLQYIRTGANASGKEFTEEQFTLVKEVAFLLADRSLNVKVTTDNFISYKDKETKAFIDNAWKLLDKEINKAKEETKPANKPQRPQAQAPAINPVVAKLQELMTKALDEGDFDKYDQLEARLNKMQAQAPVAEETNEVEVPDDVQEDDPTAGSDEVEL